MRPVREITFGLGVVQPCTETPCAEVSHGPEDMELLKRYSEQGDTAAFEQIVSRHIGWVLNMCRRGLRDRHLAEDAAQAVFTILSRKAAVLPEATKLSGWLFKTTRFAINDARKIEFRYRRRQELACEFARQEMNSAEKESFDRLEPALDDALASLSEKDRQAIMLHFYEGQSLDEVAVALDVSREGAKKRVYRAVEKLRGYFKRKGAAVSLPVLTAMLAAQGSDASAASLALSITSTAAGMTAPSGMSTVITEGATRALYIGTGKLLKAVLAGQFAALAIIGTTIALKPAAKVTVVATSAAVAGDDRTVRLPVAPHGQNSTAVVSAAKSEGAGGVAAGSQGEAYDGGEHPFQAPVTAREKDEPNALQVAIAEILKDVKPETALAELKAPLAEAPEVDLDSGLMAGGGGGGGAWGELDVRSFAPKQFQFNQSSGFGSGAVASGERLAREELDSGVFTPNVPRGSVDGANPSRGTSGGSPGLPSSNSGIIKPINGQSVPEPGVFTMLAGVMLLGLRRRRK